MNRCAPSIIREERSLSSHSKGFVCVSTRSAAFPETAIISPAQTPNRRFDFMTTTRVVDSESLGADSRLIVLEAKRRFAADIRAGKRRAPMSLDVLNDKLGSGKVADAGRTFRVVHRVRKIAHQG